MELPVQRARVAVAAVAAAARRATWKETKSPRRETKRKRNEKRKIKGKRRRFLPSQQVIPLKLLRTRHYGKQLGQSERRLVCVLYLSDHTVRNNRRSPHTYRVGCQLTEFNSLNRFSHGHSKGNEFITCWKLVILFIL